MTETASRATETVKVEKVDVVTGTKKDGSGSYTRFDVHLGGFSKPVKTFSLSVGAAAQSMVGGLAQIDYTEKTNGQYTDLYLEEIRPAGPGETLPATKQQPVVHVDEWTQRHRDMSIVWQVCVKAAVELHRDNFEVGTDAAFAVARTARVLYFGWPDGRGHHGESDDDIPF